MCDNNFDNDMTIVKTDEADNRGMLVLCESFATDEEYNNSNCLSYSKIKDIHDNPDVLLKERTPSTKEWMIFGTLVDLLVNPDIKIDDHVIVNDNVPTDQFLNISNYILDNNLLVDKKVGAIAEFSDNLINQIFTESGSKVNWTVTTKKEKIINECGDYLDLLMNAIENNKIIVSTVLYNEAKSVAQVLTTHRWTKDLFCSKEEQLKQNIELFYQYKIKYAYNDIMCQSKIDIVKVDYKNKTISLYDIKTGSDLPRDFIKNALFKYKYGYQGVLYNEGFEIFLDRLPLFKQYIIDDFRFIYVSRLRPTYPVIVKMNTACHREFKELGIENEQYSLIPLDDLFEEAEYYIKKIDSGETNIDPYSLEKDNGEVTVGAKTKHIVY